MSSHEELKLPVVVEYWFEHAPYVLLLTSFSASLIIRLTMDDERRPSV